MSKGNYEVGYGKPPKKSQFKKGQSGNPKGRKKGARGLKSDLRDELKGPVTVHEDGKQITVSKQRLAIKQLINQAVTGDLRAIIKLIEMSAGLLGTDDELTAINADLSEEDAAILENYVARRMEEKNDL